MPDINSRHFIITPQDNNLLILQYIPRLAIQRFAYRFQCAEAYGFGFPGFQYRKVGQGKVHFFGKLVQRHLPFGHHHIYIYYYRHN